MPKKKSNQTENEAENGTMNEMRDHSRNLEAKSAEAEVARVKTGGFRLIKNENYQLPKAASSAKRLRLFDPKLPPAA